MTDIARDKDQSLSYDLLLQKFLFLYFFGWFLDQLKLDSFLAFNFHQISKYQNIYFKTIKMQDNLKFKAEVIYMTSKTSFSVDAKIILVL